jgi:hypothetical protein
LPAPVQGTARKGRVNDVGFGVQLKKHVKEAAARKFGSDVKLIDRILELEIGEKSVVFGTLYKDMKVSHTHSRKPTLSLSLSLTHTEQYSHTCTLIELAKDLSEAACSLHRIICNTAQAQHSRRDQQRPDVWCGPSRI